MGTASYFVVAGLLVSAMTDGSGQDARFYGRRGDREFEAGKPATALQSYQLAYRVAVVGSDTESQIRLLNNIGGCQLVLFRYQEAEQTLLRARRLSAAANDDALMGGADGNVAAVYYQLDDLPAAEWYARQSLQLYSGANLPRQRLRALLTLANILSRQHSVREGEQYFLAGIRAAINLADWTSAATGWLHYGKALLENGQLEDADHAFAESAACWRRSQIKLQESQRILSRSKPPGGDSRELRSRRLRSSEVSGNDALQWNLSRLRLQQHKLQDAMEFIDSAIVTSRTQGRVPLWRLYQTRADIELARGDAGSALQDARMALQEARLSRANLIPDNDNRVGADGLLEAAYAVLIDAGNQVYLKTHDPALLRETFEAAEENRAESLQALLPTSSDWRAQLPVPQYWDKLSELTTEQRQAVRFNSTESRERVARLQTELSEMEAAAQARVHPQAGTVLARVEKNLPRGACLLSFHLGEQVSWLWAADYDTLQLYGLPPKTKLLREIRDFQDRVRNNDVAGVAQSGSRLYRHLFGVLDNPFARSSQWFISADEALYEVPMAALVVKVTKKGPQYLTQTKTLEIVPGAQLLDAPVRGSLIDKRFVAAGDGIYNRADPRYGRAPLIRPASWSMARLPASGAEVRFAARLWPNHTLLTGSNMTSEALFKQIKLDPDVIHIASHVIAGQGRWRAGILALGMAASGEPDLLTPREILLHPIHSRLVVMTGCSSGSGDALPASGLMGLTRAWLAAGAGEVLATRWPTTDEGQDGLIGSFYLHLLASSDGDIPAALREAREEMIAHGGWHAQPRYWSGFFLIGVR